MKVLVTTVVSLNPGDAAILLGTMRILCQSLGPDVEVVAVDKNAETASRLYPWIRFVPSLFRPRRRKWLGRWIERRGYSHRLLRYDALRLRWAARCTAHGWNSTARTLASPAERAVLREYVEADLVIASGGTYLVPNYDLEVPLLDYEFALAIGKCLGIMPQSMGPFTDRRFSKRMRSILTQASFLFLRDERSWKYVQELGVPMSRAHVVPDAAFALSGVGGTEGEGQCQTSRGVRPPRIAISVRYWPQSSPEASEASHDRYVGAIAGLVSRLVGERNAEITFVSSCQGVPEYWMDDSRTAQGIVARLPAHLRELVKVDVEFRDPEGLLGELRKYDLVVATRMHVAILAICSGVAVLPIAYEFKTRELFRNLGLDHLVVDLNAVSADALAIRCDELLDDDGSILNSLTLGRNRLLGRLEQMVEVIHATAESADRRPMAVGEDNRPIAEKVV